MGWQKNEKRKILRASGYDGGVKKISPNTAAETTHTPASHRSGVAVIYGLTGIHLCREALSGIFQLSKTKNIVILKDYLATPIKT